MKLKKDTDPKKKKNVLLGKSPVAKNGKISKRPERKLWNKKFPMAKIAKGKNAGNTQGRIGEKPNWQDVKKKNKELKLERQSKRKQNLFDDIKKAKRYWEKLRTSKNSPTLTTELTEKLIKLLNGKIPKVVQSHDMSRIVQWLMKLGSDDIKQAVANELIDDIVTMAKCKYTHHSVKAILKYGTPGIRKSVIAKFYGNVVKLLSSKFGCPLIEEVYSKHSNKIEKIYLKQELYGDVFKQTKDGNISCLYSAFKDTPDLKDAILNSTKTILMKLVEKAAAVNSSLVHSVVYDYLCNCQDSDKLEFINLLHAHIRSLIFTKDGSKVGRLIMWCGPNKLKKKIVKDLRLDFKDICMNEHGIMFLLAMIDSVDDTVLLKKCLLPCIVSNSLTLAHNEYGRKVLFYLVAHRNPSYFHPVDLKILRHADESEFTKKDCSIRMKELMGDLIEPLLINISKDPSSWFKNGKVGMVTLAILKAASPGKQLTETYDVISQFITDENAIIIEGDKPYNIIEHSGMHLVLKKLILHDKEISSDIEGPKTFSECLVSHLTEDVLKRWILQNRGCFMLIFLIETMIPSVLSDIKLKLKDNKALMGLIKEKNTKGSEILITRLKELM